MRLIDNDRVLACGDFRLPFLCPFNGSPVGIAGIFRVGDMQQPPKYKGEFLKRRDHNLCAVDQRFGKLSGIVFNGFHDALCVFYLIDGVLKLLVENAAIGYHDYAVEDLLIGSGMQA